MAEILKSPEFTTAGKNDIAGILALYKQLNESNENVITDINYRKTGIGRKLIEMAIEYAKENNCYKAVLQSGIKRTGAHEFYEKLGFNPNAKRAFEMRF